MSQQDNRTCHLPLPQTSWRMRSLRLFASLLCLLLASACAVKHDPAYFDAQDPWEGYNRSMFAFNEGVYSASLRPAARLYNNIPDPIRQRVSNFFSNIDDVPNAINGVLQADPEAAGASVARFLVNTTIGILGMFDPATRMGLRKHDKDFGETLGIWGVPSGPYLVAPLLGPSSMRDFPGRVVDIFLSPINLVSDTQVRMVVRGIQVTDEYAGFLDQEEVVRKIMPDFYRSMKNFYLSKRRLLIEGDSEVDTQFYEESL